jgi:hypothetical protein
MIGAFLRQITAALELHGVPYMLTGSLASSMYGIPRATNDVDIVIAPTRDQLLNVVQMFQRVGLNVHAESALNAYRNRSQFNVIDFPKSLKVDLILQRDREFSIVEFKRRQTHEVEGIRLTVATPEDVVIAKLEWAKIGDSNRQLQDAAGILKMQRETLDFGYIEEWVEALQLHEQWTALQEQAG